MPLSEELIRVIYEEDIKPALFNKVKSVEDPTSIFLAGQPGAGKSGIAELSVKELNNNAVIIDPDYLRKFHPDIKKVSDQYSLDVDSRKWKAMLIQDCIKEKKNIVFDGTFGGNMDYIEQDIRKVKDNGHKIKINALAANDSVSKIGFNYRYEDQLNKYGQGRPVDLSYHNEIYKKIPHNITTAIGKDLVDEMTIFKRNHETRKSEVIKSFDKNVLKTSKDTAIYEFDKERARPFTEKELTYLKEWYSKTEILSYSNGNTNPNLKSSITTDDNKASDELKKQIATITDTKNMIPNLELKDAVRNKEPLKAYEAIKKGAEVSSLRKEDFKGLNILEEKGMKLQMQRALNEQLSSKDQGQFKRTGQSI